jgi:phospholipid transport system substrate-binding protein
MQRVVHGGLIALLSLVGLGHVGLAAELTPTAFIRQTTEAILQVFTEPQLQGAAQRQQRLARLRHIAHTAFDWEEIARRALAAHWRARTPQERREFTDLFRDAILGMYVERLEAAAQNRLQEKQDILYEGEQVDGPRALVHTTIVTRRQRRIPMTYRLRHADGQWRIYDIVIAGVSLVSNYRAQFQQIITQSSYEELVRRLKARQLEDALAEPLPPPR